MINIENVTVECAAEFPSEWWETAEQIIRERILDTNQLTDPVIMHCLEHTIICTDQSGQFICQVFMPTAYDNNAQIIRETLAEEINNLQQSATCILFYYSDGFQLTGGNVDLSLSVDLSDQDSTVNFSLTDGSDITFDFDQVKSFTIECADLTTADKTWTFDLASGSQIVISYDAIG